MSKMKHTLPIFSRRSLIEFVFRSESSLLHKHQSETSQKMREIVRDKRELSVIDNFEVLRRVFLDAMKDRDKFRRPRATRAPRIWRNQIQDNQNIFESIG